MAGRTFARVAAVPLLGFGVLVCPTSPAGAAGPAEPPAAAPASVAAASLPELHVSSGTCTSAGDGSPGAPFCTISAAATVAQPGQTVLVRPGNYPESVRLTRSGTADAPITFRAVNGPDLAAMARVGRPRGGTGTENAFTLTGVHDVVIEGFNVGGQERAEGILVDRSSRITLDSLIAFGWDTTPAVRVGGGSVDVTVSRTEFFHQGGLVVNGGATGVVVTANTFRQNGLFVQDGPGTRIVGNTFRTECTQAVDIIGTSPGAVVRNNIVQTASGPELDPSDCGVIDDATGIAVSAQSTPGTVADYNLIDPSSGAALYRWAGVEHRDLAAFVSATGQGGHDIAANPRLVETVWNPSTRGYYVPDSASPAIDSADPTAVGASRTDMLGNPHTDHPDVANSGASYHDRGAVEVQGPVTVKQTPAHRTVGGTSTDVAVGLTVTPRWTTDGPIGTVARRWSDESYWQVGPPGNAEHQFRRAGKVCETHEMSLNGFRRPSGITRTETCTVVGATYTALSPMRVLDTRAAIGVGGTTPVPANSEIVLSLPQVGGVPAADITAVVLNLTVTGPTTAGFLRVWPDGAALPDVSNLNFVAGETVPNLVTVPTSNGRLRIRNTGGGTAHVVADLQGFYATGGSGFRAVTPSRVLDTRGAGQTAFPANVSRTLDLTGRVPAGTRAAVLNVTVTRPTASGVLKVYPAGSAVPTASSLNFVAGQTIPNLVIVPVVNGRVAIHNQSAGSTHLVVDLAGWFGPAASDSFVPYGPERIQDTRAGGQPMGPWTHYGLLPRYLHLGLSAAAKPSAVVANVTVTGPTAAGVLNLRPNGADVPTASNLNFVAGETATNLVMVGVGEGDQAVIHNGSSGRTHVIVDQSGYFIPPAS
ncbi:right-handed parallel beta-helix repeat-containing protein [Micromonospora sp. NPDC000089]|uniref:right-handed parallel beta-helix repeat-containing protein n=1 Tax=unclassified Micromonospora TaxID=2617518 RepID=UPI0036A8B9F4